MPSKLLTDRFVNGNARPKTRQAYFDTKVRGLTLRWTPSGAKSWWFVYRVGGKPSQWMPLGAPPKPSLADVRRLASDHRRDVDQGIDPIAKAKAAREAAEAEARQAAQQAQAEAQAAASVFTFRDMAQLYKAFAKGRKKEWAADMQKIEKYLIPAWGDRPLRDITRTHVHELLDTVVAKGLTTGVNRLQAVISRIFTVALDRSLVEAHPAARMLKRFEEVPGERVLSDDELRALWTGLEAFPGRAADCLRLRLLLGQRGGETAGMLWREVDLDAALWEMPGSRTKNGHPHAVPLPAEALTILTRRRQALPETEPRVFPGLTVRSDDHRALSVLHGGQYTWIDLRRTVGTRLGDLGYDDTTIGRTLNHAKATITGKVYNKALYLPEKTAALAAWDRELRRIFDGKPKARATVVPIGRGQ